MPTSGDPIHTVILALGRQGEYSRVFVDDVDITGAVVGVEVRAFVGELTTVTVTLSARVELTAEVVKLLAKADDDG